jgi:hypothetical protein
MNKSWDLTPFLLPTRLLVRLGKKVKLHYPMPHPCKVGGNVFLSVD